MLSPFMTDSIAVHVDWKQYLYKQSYEMLPLKSSISYSNIVSNALNS